MAVPKRKTSKQRKHKRAASWKVSAPTLQACPQCNTLKLSHRVCKTCGYYIVGKKRVQLVDVSTGK